MSGVRPSNDSAEPQTCEGDSRGLCDSDRPSFETRVIYDITGLDSRANCALGHSRGKLVHRKSFLYRSYFEPLHRPKTKKHSRKECFFVWSGLRGSNPPPPPWQGGALPNELNPHKWCLRSESNQRHEDFQSSALPTELQRRIGGCYFSKNGDSDGARTHDL